MAESFLNQVLVLQITLGLPGNTRQVEHEKRVQFASENDAVPETVKIAKTLFTRKNCPEFYAIVKADNQMRKWLEQRSLPNYFGKGMYMVTEGVSQQVHEVVTEIFPARREALIADLGAVYPQRIAAAQREMGQLFAALDFPQFEEYARGFVYRSMYRPKGIDQSLFILGDKAQAEEEKIREEVQETRELITTTLRAEFSKLISDMVERLKPGKDGQRKKFHNSSIVGFNTWLELFEQRNLLGDAALNSQVKEARRLLEGASPEMLRSDDALRHQVCEQFSQVKAYVDQNLKTGQIRMLR